MEDAKEIGFGEERNSPVVRGVRARSIGADSLFASRGDLFVNERGEICASVAGDLWGRSFFAFAVPGTVWTIR